MTPGMQLDKRDCFHIRILARKAYAIHFTFERMSTSSLLKATGIILAGGKSTRFGRNKSLEPFYGAPLIQHGRDALSHIFQRLIVVGPEEEAYSFLETPVYRDIIPEKGPLGGIYTGLTRMENEWGFIIACDMPFINEKLVRHMFEARSGYDIVAPRVGKFIEPLHALYNRRCVSGVKRIIDSGRKQVILLYEDLKVHYIEEEEIRGIDPEMKSFSNINTPDDLPVNV